MPEYWQDDQGFLRTDPQPAPPTTVTEPAPAGLPATESGAQPLTEAGIAAMDPMAQRELGYGVTRGRAPVEEGFTPQARTGAVEERAGAPERREAIYEDAQRIEREKGEITVRENELARNYLDEQIADTARRTQAKQAELGEVDDRYKEERTRLDEAMNVQRELLSQGVGMERVLGTRSGQFGALMSAVGMGIAGFGGAQTMRNSMDMYDRTMKNIMKTQEMESGMAQQGVSNAYNKLEQTFGDRTQARTALEMLINDAAAQELNKLKLQNADPRARVAVDAQLNELASRNEALEEKFHERSTGTVKEAFREGQAGVAGGRLRRLTPEEMAKNAEVDARYATARAKTAKAGTEMARAAGVQRGVASDEDMRKYKPEVENIAKVDDALLAYEELVRAAGYEGIDANGQPVGKRPSGLPAHGLTQNVFNVLLTEEGAKFRAAKKRMQLLATKAVSGGHASDLDLRMSADSMALAGSDNNFLDMLPILGERLMNQRNSKMSVVPEYIGTTYERRAAQRGLGGRMVAAGTHGKRRGG